MSDRFLAGCKGAVIAWHCVSLMDELLKAGKALHASRGVLAVASPIEQALTAGAAYYETLRRVGLMCAPAPAMSSIALDVARRILDNRRESWARAVDMVERRAEAAGVEVAIPDERAVVDYAGFFSDDSLG